LLGLGETRADTIEALLRIRTSHERWGHVQELIVQPFRPKARTRMAGSAPFPETELLWAVAAAKLILGPCGVPIQSPPNLSDEPQTISRTHARLEPASRPFSNLRHTCPTLLDPSAHMPVGCDVVLRC
jgi:2-iminoacetate synthase ThiH